MTKVVQNFQVLGNKKLNNITFILELRAPEPLPPILPGQFVQVRVDGSTDTFLRRPFSVYDTDYNENTIKLLIQIAGKGTETLSKLAEDDTINLVFPLGNSFSMPSDGEKILLAGGGVGIAPFMLLAKQLKSLKCEVEMLFGFRNRERTIEYEEFSRFGKVYITTEDGSAGEKGFVTDHTLLKTVKYNRIYCCGPDPMMKAVASYAASRGIFCEVSLENLMACGFGICLCCIVPTTRGNVCTCTEGPVFNINELKW